MNGLWNSVRVCSALSVLAIGGALAAGCIERPIGIVRPVTQVGIHESINTESIDKVDLLLEVDNSGSMAQNQANIAGQLQRMMERLTRPPLGADGRPLYPAVRDLHVGVISSDLGALGSGFWGAGDDGVMNPLARGAWLSAHRPAPDGVRDGCVGDTPSFLRFESASTDVAGFSHDFRCTALLGTTGSGIEQQLESAYRAIVTHRADDSPGNTDPNAGFLREEALLAIVILTDEEDGSVRDCNNREPDDTNCVDARTAFNPSAPGWASTDLEHFNYRFYGYTPCGPQDPTWRLDRYVDPSNLRRGFMSLKPSHPERIVFAAITSVPLALPVVGEGATAHTDWDALLGAPVAGRPDDFCGRDALNALSGMSPQGPISLRQPNPEPGCDFRPVPACRRNLPGTTIDPNNPACDANNRAQYVALPSRRIIEIARRFDESPMCNGAPCHNGLVASICSDDFTSAMDAIVGKIQSRLPGRCFARALQQETNAITGERTVQCVVHETLRAGVECSAVPGRTIARDSEGNALTITTSDGAVHAICDLAQVPTNAAGVPVSNETPGWFYEQVAGDNTCAQRISFTGAREIEAGVHIELDCIQSVTGGEATVAM